MLRTAHVSYEIQPPVRCRCFADGASPSACEAFTRANKRGRNGSTPLALFPRRCRPAAAQSTREPPGICITQYRVLRRQSLSCRAVLVTVSPAQSAGCAAEPAAPNGFSIYTCTCRPTGAVLRERRAHPHTELECNCLLGTRTHPLVVLRSSWAGAGAAANHLWRLQEVRVGQLPCPAGCRLLTQGLRALSFAAASFVQRPLTLRRQARRNHACLLSPILFSLTHGRWQVLGLTISRRQSPIRLPQTRIAGASLCD